MKKTLIDPEKWKVMRWKNGAGVTAEIAIAPAGSTLENFDWRISSARIEKESRFSPFPGYDRMLTVLSGAGLALNGRELRCFEVFKFSGEDVIECRPLEGTAEDLGIIYKRDQFQCSMQVVELTAPTQWKVNAPIAFFRPWSAPLNFAGSEVGVSEFLKVEMASRIAVTASAYPTRFLAIEILKR